MTITKGESKYSTVYERLRKRSYRKYLEYDANFDPSWQEADHKAYVKGVRDALTEVLFSEDVR